ncbi:hypothetical protein Tco_0111638 [Tanacetum coccineum]
MMTETKFDIEKFDRKNDFGLWQVRMKALLEQQGLVAALEELPAATIVAYDNVIQRKAYNALILCLGDWVLREITKETTAVGIWKKLETLYMTKSLANHLYLKRKFYTFQMHPGKSHSEHIDEFHKMVGDLAVIDTAISDKDQALLLLLTSLPSSYDNFVETLLYGQDTLKLEDIVRGKVTGKKQQTQVSGSRADRYDSAYHITYMRDYFVDFEEYDGGKILLGDGKECRIRGTGKVTDEGWVKFHVGQCQSVKIKVIKGSLVVLSGTRRTNCVYTVNSQVVTRKTLKGRKQLEEYQTGWKIKKGNSGQSKVHWAEDTTMSTYLVNRSPSSTIRFKTLVDVLGFFGWLASIKQGMLEPVKSSSYSWDTVKVLQGVEFEVEPQKDHTFKVEPYGNVNYLASSQEVQTQDLIYYYLARDRDQHSTHELFSYREDNNEAAFVVTAVDKIYAHESLTFNNTVACEVISRWKAGLKDDMDARSDVYMLSNGCKKCSDESDGYYWECTPGMFIHLFLYIDDMVFSCGCKAKIWATNGLLDKAKRNVLGMEIVRDQSGNTLRVSQSRFYNGKLVQTLLEGHSILSLEGSLSGDCDVEKNGKWSCIYAVGSQEYQMVYSRLDLTSADVGMLDKFDRGLQTDVQVFVDFDYAMERSITVMVAYMTLTESANEAIWLKGLAIESGFELKIVAGIAIGALSKAIPGPRFQHRLNLLSIGKG